MSEKRDLFPLFAIPGIQEKKKVEEKCHEHGKGCAAVETV